MKITIKTKSVGEVPAEIEESKNPKTAQVIINSLPIRGRANRWGEEIYFSIDVSIPQENAQQDVEEGDLAYWLPGEAFCIFFGPTPASLSNKPRAAGPVCVFGKVTADCKIFNKVRSGEEIIIAKME